MKYKDFSNFKNIELKFGSPEAKLNYGYTAEPLFPCAEDPYFDNQYFLLYRRSKYAAQVELACAKIFKKLMGYGLDMELVKEDGEYYVASRKITNFREFLGTGLDEQDLMKVRGFMALFVIWYFIGQTDTHGGNYGLAPSQDGQLVFGLDMAEALDFKMLRQPLELNALQRIPYIAEEHYHGLSEIELPTAVAASESFQQEKLAMIQLIAKTPFEIFEKILRETITTDFLHHQTIFLEKMLKNVEDASIREQARSANALLNPAEYSLDALIECFKVRHQQWQVLAQERTEVFEQDFTLADNSLFLREVNSYHGDSSSESDEEDSQLSEEGNYSRSPKLSEFSLFSSSRDEEEEEDSPLILPQKCFGA